MQFVTKRVLILGALEDQCESLTTLFYLHLQIILLKKRIKKIAFKQGNINKYSIIGRNKG